MASPTQRKSTFRSRVGGAMRRSSTAFSIPSLPNRGNSVTPPPSRGSDTASIAGSVYNKTRRKGSVTSLNKIDTPVSETRPQISRPSTPSIITNYPQTASSQIAQTYRFANLPQPIPESVSGQLRREGSTTSIDNIDTPVSDMRPLISRPSTPPIITKHAPKTASSQIPLTYRSANLPVNQPVPQWAQPARFNVNGSARNYAYGSTTEPHICRGWTEHALPHGTHYYVNEDSRAITDTDLRNLSKLDKVSEAIDMSDDVPEGCELWVRAGANPKKGWWKHRADGKPVLFWVDHRHRRVLSEIPSDDHVLSGEDERLDGEYRYWAFIESHPAHLPRVIVEDARKDAIDLLHWSHTDRLLTHPNPPPTPPPFSQDECLKLLKLLNDSNHPINAAYTRTVARILFRGAHWRQANFRPHKPLPSDVSYEQPARRRTSTLRTIFELFLGILCLGIPFLFAQRSRQHGHFDIEGSHLPESTIPLFVISACACQVSAIILSASVTIMSFPGLDSITRIGGLVAITCSVLSMVSSVVSIFRYRAEMARGTGPLADGFVILSQRSILLSLPLVFVAYSVAGFLAVVVSEVPPSIWRVLVRRYGC